MTTLRQILVCLLVLWVLTAPALAQADPAPKLPSDVQQLPTKDLSLDKLGKKDLPLDKKDLPLGTKDTPGVDKDGATIPTITNQRPDVVDRARAPITEDLLTTDRPALEHRLTDADTKLENDVERIKPLGPGGAPAGYPATEFTTTVNDLRNELLKDLPGDELAAMRAYVKATYPTLPPAQQGEYGKMVVWTDGNQTLGQVRDLITKVKANVLVSVNLTVNTQPTQARAIVTVDNAALAREVLTDGAINNLYRGRYRYRVSKNGFQDATGPLDLIDDPGTTLVCTLAPNGDKASSQCTQR